MQRYEDDYDEFEFADYAIVNRILREQMREERRFAARRALGPRDRSYDDDYDGDEDYGDDREDYGDYDDDEFDQYSGVGSGD